MSHSPLKMILIVRRDLNMRKGKMCAQCGHAAQEALLDRSSGTPTLKSDPLILEWLASKYAKICVGIKDEEALLDLAARAEEAGLNMHLVQDSGHTEFHGELTYTVLAIGPAYAEDVDPLTRELPLL